MSVPRIYATGGTVTRPAHIFQDGAMNREGQHVLTCSCGRWGRTGTATQVWEAWKEHAGPEGLEAWERWHHPDQYERRHPERTTSCSDADTVL